MKQCHREPIGVSRYLSIPARSLSLAHTRTLSVLSTQPRKHPGDFVLCVRTQRSSYALVYFAHPLALVSPCGTVALCRRPLESSFPLSVTGHGPRRRLRNTFGQRKNVAVPKFGHAASPCSQSPVGAAALHREYPPLPAVAAAEAAHGGLCVRRAVRASVGCVRRLCLNNFSQGGGIEGGTAGFETVCAAGRGGKQTGGRRLAKRRGHTRGGSTGPACMLLPTPKGSLVRGGPDATASDRGGSRAGRVPGR